MIDAVERAGRVFEPWLDAETSGRLVRRLDGQVARGVARASLPRREVCLTILAWAFPAANAVALIAPRAVALWREAGAPSAGARLGLTADIPAWPLTPKLAGCPADLCAGLLASLTAAASEPEARHAAGGGASATSRWLAWLHRQLEMRRLDAGWDPRAGVRRVSLTDAVVVIVAAHARTGDPRYLNTLLRLGDVLLQAPRLRRDLPLATATLTACLVREAAMRTLALGAR